MPDTAPSAPPVDLAGLIPTQRVVEPEVEARVDEAATPPPVAAAPERLALLWTLLGALVGSAVVAGLFLALMALLP